MVVMYILDPTLDDAPELSSEELAQSRDRLGDGDDSGQYSSSISNYTHFG